MLGHIHIASPAGWIDLAAHLWIWLIAIVPAAMWVFYELVGWFKKKRGRSQ